MVVFIIAAANGCVYETGEKLIPPESEQFTDPEGCGMMELPFRLPPAGQRARPAFPGLRPIHFSAKHGKNITPEGNETPHGKSNHHQ